eukprot:CAMPEP_0203670792 /NCGR_PEP_ID=MMETSP0090-20130426/6777_1 /ASSEMBLY_ACC=CAM_ASM_001088 /TAXON_ID=426623 /ORGANISM="Chaetoceros affinis, Strain CCMP159" /LENGTH=511 /DNA_ID=CAMNT_0050535735 /DNA_START=98 /DNA_END=1633 /DNA_ORIENTATION=-
MKELHIAPMLDVSTPEFHNLMRILSKKLVLWTEMVVDETIMFSNDLDHHLAISSEELHPIICQVGGRSAEYCYKATQIVKEYGYDEINLNVDCPSSRVSGKRQFGAVLMASEHQDTCYDVVAAMKNASEEQRLHGIQSKSNNDSDDNYTSNSSRSMTISVKTRVGIETEDGTCCDDIEYLSDFIHKLQEKGCCKFFIHARKCVIGGLTPAQNRLVPPLNYPRFFELCHRFPHCEFIINGGIPGLEAARNLCYGYGNSANDTFAHNDESSRNHGNIKNIKLFNYTHSVPCKICNASNGSCTAPPPKREFVPSNLSGVMIGRAAMENPTMFWDVDRYFYGAEQNPTMHRRQVLEQYCAYLEKTYPRRCCDIDERITSRIPAPVVEFLSSACDICGEFYGNNDINNNNKISKISVHGPNNSKEQVRKPKISSRVIDRSLKPILGLFFGRPKSKLFRRECDRLSRDKNVRNCGPAYIIRKAMSKMPSALLEEEFIRTEDLNDEDVPVHVSPGSSR